MLPHIFSFDLSFYILEGVKVGDFSSIHQLFLLNSEFKTSASRYCANQFCLWWWTAFIQTDLSEAVLYFVGAIIQRVRGLFYSGTEYLLKHQWYSMLAITLTAPAHYSRLGHALSHEKIKYMLIIFISLYLSDTLFIVGLTSYSHKRTNFGNGSFTYGFLLVNLSLWFFVRRTP